MSTALAAKVRLVKCPKCRQLLTEYPHFDVYACGGCGTTLQAKKRSEDVKSRSSSHETEAAQGDPSDLGHSIQEATRSPSGDCHMHENSGRNIKENGEFNEELHGHFTLSDGEQKKQLEINKLSDLRIKEHLDSEKDCSTEALPDSVLKGENSEAEADDSNSPLMVAEELNNDNLSLGGAEDQLCCASDGEVANNEKSAELDVTGSDSISRSSSTEKLVSDTENIPNVTAHEPRESITSVIPASVNQTSSRHSFGRVRSVDTFDAAEITNPSSELSGILGEMSKSPTTRSYHAYDGSISSCDRMDEGFPNQHLKPFNEPYTAADVVSEGRNRRGKVLVNSMTNRDPETQEDSMNFSSDFPNRRHHVMEDTERKKSKMVETRDNRHVLNQVRPERDYYPSRMPFHHGDPQSYDSGSPSSQLLDEFYSSSSFLSSDAFEDPDPEKVKLLRMIYKLQDQLDRTISVNGETDGRRSIDVSYRGKYISAYHSHDLDEGRFRHSIDYPTHNGRCNHGINWTQRRNSSWMPFSPEATCSRDHVDHSCLHCRQCSAELSPHFMCQHEELCSCHNFHFPHRSCPSSPQWFIDSGLPVYSHGTKSGDRRHRTPEVKKYFREKQYLAKRHFRPLAGGAPFVTCRKCFELLQLPADFLLFKRSCHQLKCGSCSEVLKFSLQNRRHIVSYAPNAFGPPPSKLNDQSEEISGRTFPSSSHVNHYHNRSVDPVSYSDDNGPSVLHGGEYGRSDTPSTFESEKGKEKIASRHSSTSMAPEATYESAGLSSDFSGSQKLSSEMEPASPAGKLHGLMGYSSPSEVIRGVQSSSAGTSSRSTENMDDLS